MYSILCDCYSAIGRFCCIQQFTSTGLSVTSCNMHLLPWGGTELCKTIYDHSEEMWLRKCTGTYNEFLYCICHGYSSSVPFENNGLQARNWRNVSSVLNESVVTTCAFVLVCNYLLQSCTLLLICFVFDSCKTFLLRWTHSSDRLCGLVVRVSGYRSRGPGFDSQPYKIFWQVGGQERGPLSLVITNEELLEKRSSGSGLENRD
jgi:hypothetical protein